MPRRNLSKRHDLNNPPTPSKRRAATIEELQRRLDALTGNATGDSCIAIYMRDTGGRPFMSIMGDNCPQCVEFRAGIPKPVFKDVAPTPTDDAAPDPHDEPAATGDDADFRRWAALGKGKPS